MSRAERDKGARGEREVCAILERHDLPAVRTSNSGGLHVKGDLTGVPGYHFEVKRQETLRLPAWLRQAEYDGRGGACPRGCIEWEGVTPPVRCPNCGHAITAPDRVAVVAWRQNQGDWYAALPLRDLAKLLDLARLTS